MVSPSNAAANAATIAEILQIRAATTPDDLAYLFLIHGEEEGPRLTYGGVDQAARAIAATLRDVAEPGDRALLVYEPGLDLIPAYFGCVYAGLVPVPVCPPRLDRLAQSWQVLRSVTADCEPRVGLTTGELAAGLANGFRNFAGSERLRWLATDQIDGSRARSWHQPHLDPDALALLQYTSGSTAAPKGVMVTHRNLMHNLDVFQNAVRHPPGGRGVSWLPLYHDMGLIGGVLRTAFHGAQLVLMSPLGMLQKPFRWLQAVSRYRAQMSAGPNFAYDWCVQRVTLEEKATLDLSHWAVAAISAEPISALTLERFSDTFAGCGFRREAFFPIYGLAEGTLVATSGSPLERPTLRRVTAEPLTLGRVVDAPAHSRNARTLVGCGRSWLDQQLAIVHPDSLLGLADGTVGEIWLAGPSVAQGYWNRPDETERTFRARRNDTGEGPFLRTGDLGFIQENQLFITGRIKDVIVIRGRNHYPQDIEATVQAVHPGLRAASGAAFETGPDGQPRLVVVQEVNRGARGVDLAKLVGDIREAVAESHELHVHDVLFLEPGSLPRTSSGKIQRHVCRAGYERGTLRRWSRS